MPLFPNLERKAPEDREPISHEIQPHNRAYRARDLDGEPTPARPARSREEQWAAEFQAAKDELDKLTPANAVRQMERLPRYLLECYLLAEEVGQARPLILQRFPKPGQLARQRYTPKKTPSKRRKATSAVGQE